MPGIGIGIGVPFRHGIDWAAYWAEQTALFLFFGQIENISGGQLPNEMNGSADVLTVTGAPGSYTFQCPNTAAYIAADINVQFVSDYLWFKPEDASRRTVTEAELIGYDFTRTLIKYDNNTPYTIRWIAILKPGQTVTDDIRDSFELSIWWDNILNDHGAVKGNRGVGQSVWTLEYEYETLQYIYGLTTPLSSGQLTLINTFISDLKTNLSLNYLSDAFDTMQILANETEEAALRNLVKRAHDAVKVGTPVFVALEGYTGAVGKSIDSNYNPKTEGSKYAQYNASVGIYTRTTLVSTGSVLSCSDGTNTIIISDPSGSRDDRVYINDDSYTTVAIVSAIGLTIKGRSSIANVYNFCNKNYATANTSTGTDSPNANIIVLNQVAIQCSFYFTGRYFTQTEMGKIQDCIEAYMDANGKGVIT